MIRNFLMVTVISLIAVSCAMLGMTGKANTALKSRVIEAPQERVFAALADEDNLFGMTKVTDTGDLAVYEMSMDDGSDSADEADENDTNSGPSSSEANKLTIRLTRPKRMQIIVSGDNPDDKRTMTADLVPVNDGKFTSVEFNGNIGETNSDGSSNAEFTAEGRKFVDDWLDRAEKKAKS